LLLHCYYTAKMSAIENMSEIIQREVEAVLSRFQKNIFDAIKEDYPEIDAEEYDLQLGKFAKNAVKKIVATKEFKSAEKKLSPSKKEKRDPDAPKPVKNAFILFCSEKRAEVKEEEPDMKPTDITKKLGEMWREMDDEDKEEFQEKVKKDKERFENEMEEYEPKDGFRCPKKSPKKDKSPKRARSAYIFFCGDKRVEVTEELVKKGKKKTEVLKKLGEMWRELDDEDKEEYDKMAKKDKKRYENEMKNASSDSEDENDEKPKKSKKSKDSEDENDEKPKKSKKSKEDKEKPKSKKTKSKKTKKTKSNSSDSDDDLSE
jgi:hypothetical protein